MLLKKLIAKNVYSFDNIEVDLCRGKVIQITGTNLDEARKSNEESVNGIGKTNLYNLIIQCLYSRDIAKTTKGFLGNMFTDKDFYIELWVDDNVVIYSKSSCALYRNGNLVINGRSAITAFFEEIMPFDLFLPLTYISSSVYFPFFDATPKQQKEFITLVFADLLKTREAIPILKEKQAEIKDTISSCENKIEVYREQVEEEIETPDFDIPELPELKDYSIDDIERQIKEIERLEQKKMELDSVKKPTELENKEDEIISIRDRISKGEVVISNLERDYANLVRLEGYDACPTCGQPITLNEGEIQDKNKEINKYKAVLAQLFGELKTLKQHQAQYAEYEKELAIYNKSQNELASIHISDKEPLVAQVKQMRELDKEQKEEWKNIKELREVLIRKVTEIETKQKIRDKALIELAQLEQTEQESRSLLHEVDILVEICDKVIVEKQIPERLTILEKFINVELSNFTSQYKIKLEMKDTKIQPKVIKLGKEYPYKNCSQGERGRINLALLLAIRNILKVLGKSTTNILFIDELLNIIDSSGKEIIVDTLSNMNLNSFIVCHDFTFDIFQLVLIKKDNKTYVQN